jgi:formylglycine-generating enzyme required for sulfatase activity
MTTTVSPRIGTRDVIHAAHVAVPNVQTWGGMEFVRIPAGKFLMGSKEDNKLASADEKPQHTVEIPYDYWMARYPVTNEEFAQFVETATYRFRPEINRKKKANHPIVNVTWYDAMRYCDWSNKVLRVNYDFGDLTLRLPTEAEWEKAARGEYGNEWPWGSDTDIHRCNSREDGKGGTTYVGTYSPKGDSPYGISDMAGNVWEWCHSLLKPYPYKFDDGREEEVKGSSQARVVRGGSFEDSQLKARSAYRGGGNPITRLTVVGFRVVIAPRLF